jgi:prepilin-type N-terminal cleavage/methylation domain-containing protein
MGQRIAPATAVRPELGGRHDEYVVDPMKGLRSSRRWHCGGFTLTECVVTVAIICLIAGILFSVIAATKTRAFIVVDMSNLRQLGASGALYAADNDDRFPLAVRPVFESGLVPREICRSPLDKTSNGIAGRFVEGLFLDNKEALVPLVPTTYIGPRDGGWTWESFSAKILDKPNPGWLIDLALAKPSESGWYQGAVGPYYRLMMDGSVHFKTMGYSSSWIDGQFEDRIVRFQDYFCDP